MKTFYGGDFSQWIIERVPHIRNGFGQHYTTIAVGDEERILAACVYYDYSGRDCQISMAAAHPKWATRTNIRAFLSYPFIDLDCERVTGCTSSQNVRMQKLFTGLGFQPEGCLRKYFNDNEDCLIFGLMRAEARRWIRYG